VQGWSTHCCMMGTPPVALRFVPMGCCWLLWAKTAVHSIGKLGLRFIEAHADQAGQGLCLACFHVLMLPCCASVILLLVGCGNAHFVNFPICVLHRLR
jgi:hypothetical protein